MFLDLIVFNSDNLKTQSLNDLSIEIETKYGFPISKQSLDKRFNKYALSFLKLALEKTLQQQFNNKVKLFKFLGFKRVLVKDSICFQIDESLAKFFPGSGGSGSNAAVRIQFEYDLLCGKINELSLNAFNEQDAANSFETIELTQAGDLIIHDLAYMSIKVLRATAKRLAFFLCRLSPVTNVYEESKKKSEDIVLVNFVKINNYMKKHNLKVVEKEVCLGQKDRFPVRLIIHRLPDEEVAKRIRKAQQNNKKKKRSQLTKKYKARAALNLFVTNAKPEQISVQKVWPIYRLRWQIELMFKIWKSICKIDKVKKVKKDRLECYIYSRLIFIALGWKILWLIAKMVLDLDGNAISYYKAFKTLLNQKLDEMRDVLFLRLKSIDKFLLDLFSLSRTKHLLEKRKNKLSSITIMLTINN